MKNYLQQSLCLEYTPGNRPLKQATDPLSIMQWKMVASVKCEADRIGGKYADHL
jgi:hypothetical protein